MTRFTGWRAAVLVVAVLVVLALLLTALFWLAAIAIAIGALVWLNLLVLPRLARRLHVPLPILALIVLILLVGGGFGVGGITGAVEGGVAWLIGIAAPRGVMWRLRRRLRTNVVVDSDYRVIQPRPSARLP